MTNSKKLKETKGASRRLVPFGHVRSKTFILMLCIIVLIFGCKKSSLPYNPIIFTVTVEISELRLR